MVKLCHHLRSLNIEITDSPLGSTNIDKEQGDNCSKLTNGPKTPLSNYQKMYEFLI